MQRICIQEPHYKQTESYSCVPASDLARILKTKFYGANVDCVLRIMRSMCALVLAYIFNLAKNANPIVINVCLYVSHAAIDDDACVFAP